MKSASGSCHAFLRAGKEVPFLFGHPWVFSGALEKIEGPPEPGAQVTLHDSHGSFIAHGLFNGKSQITLRLYSWKENQPLTEEFFRQKLFSAVRLRRETLSLIRPGAGCRVVFSEGDGLSGLVADFYDSILVVQFTSLALSYRKDILLSALEEALSPAAIYLRTEKGIRDLEGLEIEDGLLKGAAGSDTVLISENGIQYEVNFKTGHKTGFYMDQRDNRARAALFAQGKKCLDLFCYSGGFSMNLMKAGALEVTGVDASANAILLAEKNAARNGLSGITFMKEDAEKAMLSFGQAGRVWDLIVLDPPRFAQSGGGVKQALKGYARLNAMAMRLLSPGGMLITCSCSGRVLREEFRSMLSYAAHETGRFVRILEQRGSAPDHPVNAACPESEYLKCFFCEIG